MTLLQAITVLIIDDDDRDGGPLDLNRPGLNGFEVLKHLKQSSFCQSIPVVVLTTSNAKADQEQAHQLGAAEFITKPTTYDGLSAIAQRIRLRLAK